jgi:hypothetical protein
MSNIEKIRQEIERRKLDYLNRSYTFVPVAMQQLLEFIDSLPEEHLTWQDIKKIVNIADALLDDPKARVEFNNHNEEYYYQKVLDEYNRLHQTTEE